ncbi:MAG: ankyrin repeat domain-containing protein, partial [Bacteroidota bacterium]
FIMRILLIFTALAFSFVLNAQEENIFLDREFWKSKPTVKLIKKKIKKGHDPAAKDRFSFDGVSYAIIDDAPLKSIKYMLSQEGNPVTKPTHGSVTYLLWAAYKGNTEVMKHLLSLGSDPKMATARGTNMLLMAAIGGVDNPEVYDIILQQGIAADYTNKSGANVLLLLSGSNVKDTSILQYFLEKGGDVSSKDLEGNNLFNYAARGGNIDLMKMWIDKGVSYNTLNEKGENALLFAAQGVIRRTMRLEVFNYLSQELGLEVDMVNWEGESPLHLAARRATPELLSFFITEGVSANQIDENGNTALTNAVGGDIENVKKIHTYTKDINHQNKEGHTALTMAIKRRSKEAFDYLIENGANLDIVDVVNNNLLYYAFDAYTPDKEEVTDYIITTLQNAGVKGTNVYAQGNTLAHIAIKKHSAFLLEKAIKLGVDINHKNNLNLSPLHLAAMKAKDKTLLSILLDNGADRQLLTEFNESAYDLAIQNELLEKEKFSLSFLKID